MREITPVDTITSKREAIINQVRSQTKRIEMYFQICFHASSLSELIGFLSDNEFSYKGPTYDKDMDCDVVRVLNDAAHDFVFLFDSITKENFQMDTNIVMYFDNSKQEEESSQKTKESTHG